MPLSELRKMDLKVQYLQVDIKNKCVPIDWFIGYDTFSIYSFINLIGFGYTSQGGYLKTIFRDKDGFMVDFKHDFSEIGNSEEGLVRHFEIKLWLIYDTLKQLFIVMCAVVAISKAFFHGLSKYKYEMTVNESYTPEQQRRLDSQRRRNIPEVQRVLPNLRANFKTGLSATMLLTVFFSYFLLLLLLLNSQDFSNPPAIFNIIIANIFSYIFGSLILQHTVHRQGFYFYMFVYTFMYYFYVRVYFLSNTFLVNYTYILYVLKSAVSYLNKFSFEFESFMNTVETGLGELMA